MEDRTLNDIVFAIQRKREEMVCTANKLGFTHELTIRNSQDLDELLNEYQIFSKKQKGKMEVFFKVKKYNNGFLNRELQCNIL